MLSQRILLILSTNVIGVLTRNKVLQTFVIIIIFLGLFIWWVRHFERSQIYYPGRIIEQTPTNINLNYEDVTFNAEDGVELNGWFIPHENAIATILFFIAYITRPAVFFDWVFSNRFSRCLSTVRLLKNN